LEQPFDASSDATTEDARCVSCDSFLHLRAGSTVLGIEFIEQTKYAEARKSLTGGGLQKRRDSTRPRNFPNCIQRFTIDAGSDAFHD
jgi:hypothetical protein